MNLSKIKFGITKVFCTFEVRKDYCTEQRCSELFNLWAFFMPISLYIYHSNRVVIIHSSLGRTKSRTGLFAGELVATFFAPYAIKYVQKMNNQIEMPSLKDEAHLPEALQSALSDYFLFNGTLADIEANLWTMLETATAGCEEVGLSAKDVLEFMMLYKSTKALVSVLHSYHTKTTVELCNN